MTKQLLRKNQSIFTRPILICLVLLSSACTDNNFPGLSYHETCERQGMKTNVVLPFIIVSSEKVKSKVCIKSVDSFKIKSAEQLTVLHIKPSSEALSRYKEYLKKPKNKYGLRLLKPADSYKIRIKLSESEGKKYTAWMRKYISKSRALVLNGKVIEYSLFVSSSSKSPVVLLISFGKKNLLANKIAEEIINTINVNEYKLLTEPNKSFKSWTPSSFAVSGAT